MARAPARPRAEAHAPRCCRCHCRCTTLSTLPKPPRMHAICMLHCAGEGKVSRFKGEFKDYRKVALGEKAHMTAI